jgi:hypothetical protein
VKENAQKNAAQWLALLFIGMPPFALKAQIAMYFRYTVSLVLALLRRVKKSFESKDEGNYGVYQ